MLDIYVDADACPVKDEVYRVARRCGLGVYVVSNTYIQTPRDERIRFVGVGSGEGAADDWIAEHIAPNDICITADIPLAARCLEANAHVIGPRGKPFTRDTIGDALATRELLSTLRETGAIVGSGPSPLSKKDRSCFLNVLDRIIQQVRRKHS